MSFSYKTNTPFVIGVKDCVPTLLGYLSIGLAAGVVQKTAGLSIAEITLLSLILYAGSAQFVIAGMLATTTSISAIVLTVFFINLRHILLSASLAPYFRKVSIVRNMLIGALLTDETFGVAINKATKTTSLNEQWMHGLNLTAYLNWVVANIAGALMAQWITNPAELGLEFALPAMFIGILVLAISSRRKIRKDIIVATIAGLIAVYASVYISSSTGIIIATLVAATIGMVLKK